MCLGSLAAKSVAGHAVVFRPVQLGGSTEAELETATKKGFSAEVVIGNGIATTIRDDHCPTDRLIH